MTDIHSRDWQQLRTQRLNIAEAANEHCHHCHQPIDYSQPGNTPTGPTADHPNPRSHGHPTLVPVMELRPMHLACNSQLGAQQHAPTRTPSREW